MSKHTPGPWIDWCGYIIDDANRLIGYSRSGESADEEGVTETQPFRNGISATESDANRRLMASAPDLLGACRLLRDVAENFLEITDDKEDAAKAQEAINKAVDAILKAIGESDE